MYGNLQPLLVIEDKGVFCVVECLIHSVLKDFKKFKIPYTDLKMKINRYLQ